MKFRSVLGKSPPVDFASALLQGLAPDGGLYIPEAIPKLPRTILESLDRSSIHEIGYAVLSQFLEEIPENVLRRIIRSSLTFPIPLVKLEKDLFLLELYHGPTLAFKDVGARFMAQVLSHVLAEEKRELTILVATSGDTGSAVAHGFFGVPNITVFVLYPAGKISHLQEQQMTTLGGNIRAIEVDGTFDDCQRLVKQALVDPEILAVRSLTTANSINLGRLLPQIVYYVWAYAQWIKLELGTTPSVIVPSGNFGNLTAGMYAKSMGVPFGKFIAATNANDVVPLYFQSGKFTPHSSVQTVSNAMDVGNPSNLPRVQMLYSNDLAALRSDCDAVSISDEETLKEIKRTYERTQYILDPHTAVGISAARNLSSHGRDAATKIVVATAHPAKFADVIQRAINIEVPLPLPLQEAMLKEKESTPLSPNLDDFRQLLTG